MLPLEIPLSRGLVAVVDECNFLRVLSVRWSAQPGHKGFYAIGPKGMMMHRFIMGLPKGDPREVDHVYPHLTLINTRENLRIVTHTENQWNRGPNTNNTSEHKGVTWHKVKGLWAAQIWENGHAHHLGYFTVVEEAGLAYEKAAKELHGKFARIR